MDSGTRKPPETAHIEHMTVRLVRPGIALLLALSLAGCHFFAHLFALQKGMGARYHAAPASINVNSGTQGTVMTVLFGDSAHVDLPDSDRAAFARDVAEYVRDHYPDYPSLASITVGFSSTQDYGVVHVTRNQAPYSFSREELGPPRDTLNIRPAF